MSKNSSAKYYQGNKKQLQKRVGEKYQGLSKEEKKKSSIQSWKVHKSTRDEKQKPTEYRVNIIKLESIRNFFW